MTMVILIGEILIAGMAYQFYQAERGWPFVAGWVALSNLALVILFLGKFRAEWQSLRADPKAWLKAFWKNWGEPFVVALALALIIRTFFFGPYKIPTGSMIPTFMEKDRIFVDKISYRFKMPQRGDIIVFKYPEDKKKDYVKRLVGLPGDRVEIREGQLFINGEKSKAPPFTKVYYYNFDEWPYGKRGEVITVPPDSYFVLGDNSAHSSDSRKWGFVPRQNLVGKAFFIWWPPKRVKLVQ